MAAPNTHNADAPDGQTAGYARQGSNPAHNALRGLSLCSGYGGLDLAVEALLPVEWVAFAEFDKHAAKVFDAHWPGLPNLGDITAIDWRTVGPVDLATAGYPCQPFSIAGKQLGEDDERHLWPHILDALRVLRPRLALFENVANHLRLGFDRVLADLAAIGFDAEWTLLRASEVGAPHGRARLFIAAYPSGERHGGGQVGGAVGRLDGQDARGAWQRQWAWQESVDRGAAVAADATHVGHERAGGAWGRGTGSADGSEPATHATGGGWQQGDTHAGGVSEGGGARPQSRSGDGQRTAPDAYLAGLEGREPAAGRDMPAGRRPGATADTEGHPWWLIDGDGEAPADADIAGGEARGGRQGAGDAGRLQPVVGGGTDWGEYADAIARWERITGRRAPDPVDERGRLNPRLSEWMMGLPDGWVTDHLPRSPALKCIGNGVVPAAATSAFRHLLARLEADMSGAEAVA